MPPNRVLLRFCYVHSLPVALVRWTCSQAPPFSIRTTPSNPKSRSAWRISLSRYEAVSTGIESDAFSSNARSCPDVRSFGIKRVPSLFHCSGGILPIRLNRTFSSAPALAGRVPDVPGGGSKTKSLPAPADAAAGWERNTAGCATTEDASCARERE